MATGAGAEACSAEPAPAGLDLTEHGCIATALCFDRYIGDLLQRYC